MGAIVAVATGMAVATGVSVDCPVFGITGAAVAVLTGMAVAVGVADAHAESTRVAMRRVEKKILLFMMILLECDFEAFHCLLNMGYKGYIISILLNLP